MPKRVHSGISCREKLVQGALELSEVVGCTYGPGGRTVMLDRAAGLLSTKDGVAVAWEVEPEDPLARLGTRALQQACHHVNTEVGDGTTTTAVLAGEILREGHKLVVAGHDPGQLFREMTGFVETLLPDMLKIWHEPLNDAGLMYEVAMTASNGDSEMSQALVDVMQRAGTKGMVSVEEGKSRGIEIVQKSGMEIDRGWEDSAFCPEGETSIKHDIVLVATVDQILDKAEQVVPILEEASQFPHPVLIISKGLYGEALKTVLMNQELVKSTGVRCPGHVHFMRDHLEDLAALSGSVVYEPILGEFKSEYLGSFQRAVIKNRSSLFVAFPDKLESIEKRVAQLSTRMETTSSSFDEHKLKERIAKLTDGFCLLRVGGISETEIKERKGRLEDALHALRVAVDGGVLPGAAMAYFKLSQLLKEADTQGERLLAKALRGPLRRLLTNAGEEAEVVMDRLNKEDIESWVGWDVQTHEVVFLRNHLVDPFLVVQEVVKTAVSVAGTLLTAEVALVNT